MKSNSIKAGRRCCAATRERNEPNGDRDTVTFPKMGYIPSLRGKGGCFCGRRGLPRQWVLQMYQDYLRLKSLSKTGALHGRTRQNMFDIFKSHGLKMIPRKSWPSIIYKGVKYTYQPTSRRHHYYRATIRRGKTAYLHHVIWKEENGPIPPGYNVGFKDGNKLNCNPKNLICLPIGEMTRLKATGANQSTVIAATRTKALLNRFNRRAS